MDISNSETESTKRHRSQSRPSRRSFSALSDDSASDRDDLSIQQSVESSVPSLYQVSITRFSPPMMMIEEPRPEAKLAITTDELQFHPLHPSPRTSTRSHSTSTGNRAKHGVMTATISSNAGIGGGGNAAGSTPAHRSKSYVINDTGNNPPIRARPTVTTILRQQHVLERAEKVEKDKLDSLMVSNSVIFESASVAKRLEKKDSEEVKAAEAKRLLQARLAYERAKAASRKVIDEKQRLADETRQKEKEWEEKLAEQRKEEIARRKFITGNLQKSVSDSKRAVDEMLRLKQTKANQMKIEMENLHLEARQKQKQYEIKRQDRIQQIQASKLALRKTKESMGNPNQFYRSIAVPDTQIKLRLQKEDEKRKLEETRRKIQAEKQMKSVKLIRAMKKIQSFETVSKKPAPLPGTPEKFNTDSVRRNPFLAPDRKNPRFSNNNRNGEVELKLGEIDGMLQELNRLKEQNCLQRQSEDQYRKGRITMPTGSLKVIGASHISSKSITANSKSIIRSSGYYNHVKHDVHPPFSKRFNASNNSTGRKLKVVIE